jgi:hypothetical protein
MTLERARICCSKCNAASMIFVKDMPFRADEQDNLLCVQCCKTLKYFNPKVCPHCSEQFICKGNFLKKMRNRLSRVKGV